MVAGAPPRGGPHPSSHRLLGLIVEVERSGRLMRRSRPARSTARRTRPGRASRAMSVAGGGCSPHASHRSRRAPRPGRRTPRHRAARRARGSGSSRRTGSATASPARCTRFPSRSARTSPGARARSAPGRCRTSETSGAPLATRRSSTPTVRSASMLRSTITSTAGELVDHVEQLQHPAVGGLVELKVERPHLVGPLGAQALRRDGRVPQPPALAPPLRHPQPFLPPQALHTLAVHIPAQLAQVMMRTAIPPPCGWSLENCRNSARNTASSSVRLGS